MIDKEIELLRGWKGSDTKSWNNKKGKEQHKTSKGCV